MSIEFSGTDAETRFPAGEDPVVSIDHAIPVRLRLHPALVDSLAARSVVAGPSRRAFAAAVADGRLDAESDRILRRVVDLYRLFTESRRPSGPDPRDRSFVFVIGPPCSGGHAALRRAVHRDGLTLDQMPPVLDGEAIPDLNAILASREDVVTFAQVLFQFCQVLALAEATVPASAAPVHKRSAYAYWIAPLERYLGSAATYVVPVRHPLACAVSLVTRHRGLVDSDAGPDEDDAAPDAFGDAAWTQVRCSQMVTERRWANLALIERARLVWEAQMSAVGSHPGLGARLVPVVYSPPELEGRTTGLFGRRSRRALHNRDPRSIAHDYAASYSDFERTMDRVRQIWRQAGNTLPEIPFA